MGEFPTMSNAFLTIKDGKIADFGPMQDCPHDDMTLKDCRGKSVLPAFVDSHSHLVYAGTREQEFNLRLKGASYEEIAAAGGGILNSAQKVAKATPEDLLDQAQVRLHKLMAYGTGTLEVKSGYGLNPEGELKLLRAIKALDKINHATLVPVSYTHLTLPTNREV